MSFEPRSANVASAGWSILRAGDGDSLGLEIQTLPTEVATPLGPVRLALDENSQPRLLLPIANTNAAKGIESAPSLGIVVSSFLLKGKRIHFLDLVCHSRDLDVVFGELVDAILVRIAAGAECSDAVKSTLEDFRALLLKPKREAISISVIAGLIGELLILNRLLDRSPSAWKAWQGPRGGRHDFCTRDTSLEVKASTKAGASAVTINGLEQLEPPVGGGLHLLHIAIEPANEGALSVSSLGHAAIKKADNKESVQGLLASIGCMNVDSPEWNHQTFRLASESLYEVLPNFPRLTSSMLRSGLMPAGVSDVSYKIDLSFASSFRRGIDAYAALEKALLP